MKITRDRIKEIKEHVSIVDIASEYYTLTKNGSGRQTIDPTTANHYKTISLQEHDSVMIYPSTNSYCRMATGEGGDVLSFLMKMPETKMTFQEAFDYAYQRINPDYSVEVQKIAGEHQKVNGVKGRIQSVEKYWMENTILPLKDYIDTTELENELHQMIDESKQYVEENPTITDSEIVSYLSKKSESLKCKVDKFQFEYQYAKCNFEKFTNAYAYLAQKRNIDPGIISELLQNRLLKQDQQYGGKYVVFLSFDKDGQYNGMFKRACNAIAERNISRFETIDNATFKGFLIDYDTITKKCGIPSHNANEKRLYVFEANIDMLSYMTLLKQHGKDWKEFAFLSINGAYKYENLMKRLEEQRYQEVVIALDNDETGHTASKEIKKILDEKGIPNRRIYSKSKDWNEDLVNQQKQYTKKVSPNRDKRRRVQGEESR